MRYQELDGTWKEEENFQDRILKKMYTTVLGRMVLKPLIQPGVSRICGRFLDSRFSKWMIPPFIKANKIDMRPYEEKQYRSYNDFFTRKIKWGQRPIDKREEILISPCDGKVTAYHLGQDTCFSVKNTVYSLRDIVASKRLADRFSQGYAVVIRLSVDDYHHYCYPASGYKSRNYYIPGKFHTVNPIAVETVPVYKQNTREYCLLKTKNFGTILQMEVGALMVGKICNCMEEGSVLKGEEKGYFEFGGSTIILLLQKDTVKLKEIFFENTKKKAETKIQMGQELGKVLKIKDGKSRQDRL